MTRVKAPRPFKARHQLRGQTVDLIVAVMLGALTVYAVWGVLGAIARLP